MFVNVRLRSHPLIVGPLFRVNTVHFVDAVEGHPGRMGLVKQVLQQTRKLLVVQFDAVNVKRPLQVDHVGKSAPPLATTLGEQANLLDGPAQGFRVHRGGRCRLHCRLGHRRNGLFWTLWRSRYRVIRAVNRLDLVTL